MTEQKPVRPHRKCLRCDEPACSPSGRAMHQKLCIEHNKERRRRQAASREQAKCSCGSCASLGELTCRRCRELQERRSLMNRKRTTIYHEGLSGEVVDLVHGLLEASQVPFEVSGNE